MRRSLFLYRRLWRACNDQTGYRCRRPACARTGRPEREHAQHTHFKTGTLAGRQRQVATAIDRHLVPELHILRIDPATGNVLTVIDAATLRPESTKRDVNSVLNGIAWDPATKSLYLTGKNWPLLYKVKKRWKSINAYKMG